MATKWKTETKVKDLGWKRITEDTKKLDDVKIKSGLFGNGGGPDVNVAARGAVHEAPKPSNPTPARPFTAEAFDGNRKKLEKIVFEGYGKVVDGSLDPKVYTKKIGVFNESTIKKSIRDGNWEPLKTATKARKRSSKPLIDQAIMINSVKYKVEK